MFHKLDLMHFMKIVHRTGDFAYETQGFRNAIFGFQNVELYNGLLDLLKTENDVQETLLYKAQTLACFTFFTIFDAVDLMFYNVFVTRFSFLRMLSDAMEYLTF